MMKFNFELFSNLVRRVYRESITGHVYPVEDTLDIFQHYFQKYEDTFGKPHPPIRMSQIKRLCEAMPYIDAYSNGSIFDIEAENYQTLIDKHFQTQYTNSDYNINHFFSGKIRELRLFETLRIDLL